MSATRQSSALTPAQPVRAWSAERWRAAYLDYLAALGLTPREAEATLDSYIYAERTGKPTHGLNRLYSGFLPKLIHQGLIEPGVEPRCIDRREGAETWDARHGIGYYGIERIVRRLRTRKSSLLAVHITNLYPTGCLSQQAEELCDAGFIVFITSKSPARVTAPIERGRLLAEVRPIVGTNAHCWGFPARDGQHIIFDASLAAANNGLTLLGGDAFERAFEPADFLLADGRHPRSANEVLGPDGRLAAAIVPFGGARNHKGFGGLLPAELLHQLEADPLTMGSTTIVLLRPRDSERYFANVEDFKERYYDSLQYRDGGRARLPFDRARSSGERHGGRELYGRFAGRWHELAPPPGPLRGLRLDTPLLHTATGVVAHHTVELVRDVAATVYRLTDLPMTRAELEDIAVSHVTGGAAFFDAWLSDHYDLPRLRQHLDLLDACLRELSFAPEHSVLDVGSGPGELLKRLPAVRSVDLVDASEAMLAGVGVGKRDFGVPVRLLHSDYIDAPLEERYDRVVCIMSMHHFDHDTIARALDKCAGNLADDGLLFLGETFVDTRNLDDPRSALNVAELYLRKIVNAWRQGLEAHALKDLQILHRILVGDGEHMRTRRQWTRLLEDAGLQVIKSELTSNDISYGYLVARKRRP